jgi:Sec-independent protein secretion pathway component TatC
MFCSVCLVNTFSILILFPYIWGFFNVFNKENELKSLLSFSLELRVEEYFNFFFTFLYLVNLSIFFVLILISFLSFLDLKKKLYWKKLFTFFNVVFATLLSPPDVFSQLVFLVVLVTLFELVMFFSILQSKLNKYL